MIEELPLHEEVVPASEPLATSGLPETDKKRVVIGSAIGGGIFLGVLVAIIVLVSTEEPKPKPRPPPPSDVYPHYNPFYVDTFARETDRLTKITLINRRAELENGTFHFSDPYGYVPIVKESYENLEPQRLEVFVLEYDEHLTRVFYTDPDFERWRVPYFGNHSDPYAQAARYTRNPSGFHLNQKVNNSFQWNYFSHSISFTPIIDTHDCRLQYFDKYIEFEALLDRDYIYGMGERIESFHLKNDNYSLWNRFHPADHNSDTEVGMYSSHPFILNRLTDNKRHDFVGLFMRNSNAMIFSMWDHVNNGTTINYKMVGGVIDLFIFHTADPQYILRKYHSVIGRPYIPPVWAMGFHQARENYSVADFEEIIKKHQEHAIPVDTLWADQQMYEDGWPFTVNSNSFKGIKELVNRMHDHQKGVDMYFVAVGAPGLPKDDKYKYYLEALKEQALIMSAAHYDHPFEGMTLAGTSVWLDFFLYNSTTIWASALHDFHDKVAYDGIWLTENEPFHRCNGECSPFTIESDADDVKREIPNPFHNVSEFEYIPYRPTIDPLDWDTLHMAAYHHGDEMYHKQYYAHNLYGLQLAQATYEGLTGIFENKRFFIASRSTWPGSGQYASHWLANNYGNWESMRASISGIMNFNMFGIPHVGAPIGGFYNDVTDELLIRWFELGAFYPLMLSFSSGSVRRKEAYAFTNVEHIDYVKKAIFERYCLLRFMYTKMFESHLWGGAVVHPLFFDFNEDPRVYTREILDSTFMWASSLYIIPSLIPHQTTVRAYLPNWRWYDLRTYNLITPYSPLSKEGVFYDFEQPLGHITVLIKGGTIIPYQNDAHHSRIMNTRDLEIIPARIIVAPDHTGRAVGSMVVDTEGIRPMPDPESDTYRHYTFTYMNQIFRINKLAGFSFPMPDKRYEFDEFYEILILDNFGKHQVDFVCLMDMSMRKKNLKYLKAEHSNLLTIYDEDMSKMPMAELESIVWGSKEQHDFCQFRVHLEQLNLRDQDRVMSGRLATSDPESYRLTYTMTATALTDRIAHLEVEKNEAGVKEWRVPEVVDPEVRKVKTQKTLDAVGFGASRVGEDFFFEMSEEHDPHDFLVTTRNQPFVYVRNFIQVKLLAAGRHVFGLGERVGRFELNDGTYSIWNYDTMHEETGVPPGNNMYGFHPFYMVHTHNPRSFAGVFFLTSNPMDVMIKHIGIHTEIDHILTGGILEMFLIGKGTAEEVVKGYHYIIGKPQPLPFWAFGYHQSRWGYENIDYLKLVLRRFDEESIPLDGVWMDKDFMINHKSFTLDSKRWFGLRELIDELHKKGKHFVAIIDAGIAKDEGYSVYTRGMEAGLFIKSNDTKEPLLGITWAGYSVWVDFLHPSTQNFWTTTLQEFHDLINFDGLWLDMNEPSNFCDGECPDHATYHYYYFPLDYYDDLYYNPTHRPLEAKTISVEGIHDGDPVLATEFNYHAMYGYHQSKMTSNFFVEHLKKRPFIVSSSTFPGSGRYATHWLGDNYSTWVDMELSIAGMIHFGMYGIPFVGANICGYSGNATEQLCARWMQLGAFYPFMRNHNNPSGSPQEPYVSNMTKIASKHAILTRYSLVRYIYTEYMRTVLQGGTLVRPLTFVFPDDNDTYSTVDTSFMLGPALRITPIMQDGTDKVVTYFPNANWFSFTGFYEKILEFNTTGHKGKTKTVSCGLLGDSLNVHIKDNTIFPIQDVREGIMNVLELHNHTISLIVAPDHFHHAFGEIFYDTEHHTNFKAEHQSIAMRLFGWEIGFSLSSGVELTKYNHTDMYIEKIKIIDAATFEKATIAEYTTSDGHKVRMKPPSYDRDHKILTLEPVDAHSMNILKLRAVTWKEKA